ncbi:nucleotidyltransferase family protein [Neobacillus muris]|uniref:nucleotidyltransferase family protein n=1 Tax=Neobacillus muris TaxID=2941334 RepID=UPI00203F25C3|nr:nucleotidyltransferase family protein [Neobacillus muris]
MPKSKGDMTPSGIWIVILAAGFSRRMGTPKLLLPIGEETLIRHVAKQALLSEAAGIAVVTNAAYPEVKGEIADLPVVILENGHAEAGMSSSLRLGIEFLIKQNADAGMILLADQPDISPVFINQLCQRFKVTSHPIIQPKYNGIPSHPVLFSNTVFDGLLQISGDQGARKLLKARSTDIDWIELPHTVPKDIDTPDDFKAYKTAKNQTTKNSSPFN